MLVGHHTVLVSWGLVFYVSWLFYQTMNKTSPPHTHTHKNQPFNIFWTFFGYSLDFLFFFLRTYFCLTLFIVII